MILPHALAGGMGGIRTAGDLVSRMEFSKNMKVNDAKEYVAKKLGVDVMTLCDEAAMRELREEMGLGIVTSMPTCARGIQAKMNIEDVLGIKINSCQKFREKIGKL